MWIIFNNALLNTKDKIRISNPYFNNDDKFWHIFVEEIKHEKPFLIDGETFDNEKSAFKRFEELVTMLVNKENKPAYINPLLEKRVIDLEMTARTTNYLLKEKIIKVSDLVEWKEEELRRIPGLGAKSIKEIKETLKLWGLSLKK